MTSNKPFAQFRLKAGDTYVHCGHVNPYKPFHTWSVNALFVRPDGTKGTCHWFASCDPCFHKARGNIRKILVRGDAIWKGDEPAVTRTPNPWEPPAPATSQAVQIQGGDQTLNGDSTPAVFAGGAFAWCPGMGQALKAAEAKLGTRDLVILYTMGSGPAAVIETELFNGSVPAQSVGTKGNLTAFIVSTESALPLLRLHAEAGGRFVAELLERRVPLHEWWSLIIHREGVEACGYAGDQPTLFAVADFPGKETLAEIVTEELPAILKRMADPAVRQQILERQKQLVDEQRN